MQGARHRAGSAVAGHVDYVGCAVVIVRDRAERDRYVNGLPCVGRFGRRNHGWDSQHLGGAG